MQNNVTQKEQDHANTDITTIQDSIELFICTLKISLKGTSRNRFKNIKHFIDFNCLPIREWISKGAHKFNTAECSTIFLLSIIYRCIYEKTGNSNE